MEPTDPSPNPERLYEQALAHYRAARWQEAVNAIVQLQALGHGSPELDGLLNDVKLKQRLEATQVAGPAAPPPRPRLPLLQIGAVFGGVALVAALALGAVGLLRAPRAAPAQAAQELIGALPTAAPAAPQPLAPTPAGVGTLAIRQAVSAELALGIDNIYLILDASGSMLARVGERRKIDLAQEAMVGLVQDLPEGANVALRTYGRQRPDDCADVELLQPMGALDRAGLVAQIEAIEPVNLSRTPIGGSLAAVAADLGAVSGETLVVLVSDGEENCDADPVQIAAQLHGERPDVRVSVVGFDIAPELRERLAQIAAAGGGSYFDAGGVGELAAALDQVITPSFQVLNPAGAEVAAGQVGEAVELPAGEYSVAVVAGAVLLRQSVQVRDGMATLLTLSDEQGRLVAEVRRDWRP